MFNMSMVFLLIIGVAFVVPMLVAVGFLVYGAMTKNRG